MFLFDYQVKKNISYKKQGAKKQFDIRLSYICKWWLWKQGTLEKASACENKFVTTIFMA